ncbi:MAG TPA: hypothetical protein VGI40_04520 [Pirellulaceae bacterium]
MSRISIRLIAAAVLACFTLVSTADVGACCHHRRRCGGGGGCGSAGGCGYGGGCGGGYCYGGYGNGGYYAAMPAPLFPRLAFLNRRAVAPPVMMAPFSRPSYVVNATPARVQAVVIQNVAAADAGTPNADTRDGGGNE